MTYIKFFFKKYSLIVLFILFLALILFYIFFKPISKAPRWYKVGDNITCMIRYSGVQRNNKCEILVKLFIGEKANLVKKKLLCDFNVIFKDKYGFELGKCIFEGEVLIPNEQQSFSSSFWIEKEKINQIDNASYSFTIPEKYWELNKSFTVF